MSTSFEQLCPPATLSRMVVAHLQKTGYSFSDIGRKVGVSDSFVAEVAGGHRDFTDAHLEAFEEEIGKPLPAVLLEALDRDAIPEEKRALYDETVRLLRELGDLRLALEQPAPSK